MKRRVPSFLFFSLIFISGEYGAIADKFDPLSCTPNFSTWPPHDQLECRAPAGERIWPPSDYIEAPELSFYKFYKFGTDWFTANKVCQEDGAHLVIVDSESEALLMKHLFSENKDVLGASGIDHMWLGIHERGEQGKYYTIFGDKVEDLGYVIPWQPGQPNDVAIDDCASMFNTGVLFDDGCFMKYPFVCEIERSAVKFVEELPTLHYVPETFCNGQSCHGLDGHRSIYWTDLNSPSTWSWSPKDYLVDCKGSDAERSWPPHDYLLNLQLRSYYKVHAYGTNWFDALNVCEQEGAHLLIISSQAEAEATNSLMQKYPNIPGSVNSGHVWVGIHERGTHGQFVTPFGETLDSQGFMTWSKSPQQPNDASLDDCVSYHASTTLYDDAWTLQYHFICEIEMSAVESLRNASIQKQIFKSVCNDRTCSDRPKQSVQGSKLLKPTNKLDVGYIPPKFKTTRKPSVGKLPIKVVPQPGSNAALQDNNIEWEHTSLIKSLVLQTNYSSPDLRCQHIPIDFKGGFCRSTGCSTAKPASCDDHELSTMLHTILDEIKAMKVKQPSAKPASNTGKVITFPGQTGRATPPIWRTP